MTTSPSSTPLEIAEVSQEWSPIKKRMYKTQVCKYFIRGRCLHGPLCAFAHSVDELNRKPNLSMTKFCAKPKCSDPQCPFAHSLKELRLGLAATTNEDNPSSADLQDSFYSNYFEQQRSILCRSRVGRCRVVDDDGDGSGSSSNGRQGLLPAPSAVPRPKYLAKGKKPVISKIQNRPSPRLPTATSSVLCPASRVDNINEIRDLVNHLKLLSYLEEHTGEVPTTTWV